MTVMITDAQFNSVMVFLGILVTAVCSMIAAYWAQGAKRNSEAAKNSAQEAANEVKTNGGMSDPNPNLNDHVKYQTEMMEENNRQMDALMKIALPLVGQVADIDRRFTDHLEDVTPLKDKLDEVSDKLSEHIDHSKIMDQALAEVYLQIKPDSTLEDETD